MPAPKLPQIHLVDDDPDVRSAVSLLLKSEHLRVTTYGDAKTILEGVDASTPGCLVLESLFDGKPNKLIARDLDVSVRTVEIHRSNLMQKMGAKSAPHLARIALACDEYRDRLSPA